MTSIALCSLKHSPGVTTLALALAAADTPTAGESSPLVVELDPSGGDIAPRVGLSYEPGTVSLAAASRRATTRLDPTLHAQLLPVAGRVLVAPAAPDQAERAARAIAPRLAAAIPPGMLGVIDCGRWSTTSAAAAAIADAAVTVVVIANSVEAVEHVRARLAALRTAAGDRLALVVAGDRPYTSGEIAAALALPVLGTVPHDSRGAAGVTGALSSRAVGRLPLVRAARSLLQAVTGFVPDAAGAEASKPNLSLIGRR